MYFLVNALPPKPLDVATSNFALHRSHDVAGAGQHLGQGQMSIFL